MEGFFESSSESLDSSFDAVFADSGLKIQSFTEGESERVGALAE